MSKRNTRTEVTIAARAMDHTGTSAGSEPHTIVKSFVGQVKTPGDKDWVGNGLRFATRQEAQDYVTELSWRWTAVQETNVAETTDPVTAEFRDGRTIHLNLGEAS